MVVEVWGGGDYWASMTFTTPDCEMLDKHRSLDLVGHNQEDASGACLAEPVGDQLHHLNCAHPHLQLLNSVQANLNQANMPEHSINYMF